MKFKFKNPFKNPRFKYGANAAILTVGVIAGVVLVNLIITTLANKFPLKIDLTQNKIFELSPQTTQTLKNLKTPVNVYALYSARWDDDTAVRQIKEYLDRYQKLSPNFKLQYIDPISNPGFAQKYQQKGEDVSGGAIVLDTGSKVKVIGINDMITGSSSGGESIQVEQKLTAGLIYVTTSNAEAKVYIVQGHGRDNSQNIKNTLKAQNYTVEDLNLLATDVPDDAAAIVLSNFERDLSDPEIEKLDKYFDKGGKAFFMFLGGQPKLQKLEGYLAEWGIIMEDNIVVEGDRNKHSSSSPIILFPDMQSHDITSNLVRQGLTFIVPQSKSLTLKTDNPQRATVTSLAKTSDKSWGETNFKQQPVKGPEDKPGPLDVCAIASRDTGDPAKSPKLIVMGSSAAFDEQMLNYNGTANYDFLLNSFNWLTNKKDDFNIRPKLVSYEKLAMDNTKFIFVLLTMLIILIIIAAAGFAVWFRRRYK